MKRFQAMKLFEESALYEGEGEWITINERLPTYKNAVLKIRKTNGNEVKAFFCKDRMLWRERYGEAIGHWWDYYQYNPLDDVTHWLETKKQ
jgi:hypothetical protein